MGSPAYFGKLVNFQAAFRKNALIPFGTFSPNDNLNFIANIPGPAIPAVAPTPLAFTSTPAFDTSLGSVFSMTLTGNVTSSSLNYSGGPTVPDGTTAQLRLTQDGTGSRTFALPANLSIDSGFAIDPTAGRTTVLNIRWNNATSAWVFSNTPFSVTGA